MDNGFWYYLIIGLIALGLIINEIADRNKRP